MTRIPLNRVRFLLPHRRYQCGTAACTGGAVVDNRSITHDHHAVGNGKNFIELVGDEYARAARSDKAANVLQKLFCYPLIKR